ncbi:MAG TPA: hypothetical protein VKT78_05935 [Fimbriimonadaceae bacterium]|nr:hypothetical protein [Fimbriimonadaceae bacterium]
MDEIRRRDMKVFVSEALSVQRLFLSMLGGLALFGFVSWRSDGRSLLALFLTLPVVVAVHLAFAWSASENRRFHNQHMKALWAGCLDRLSRFQEVQKRAKSTGVADLREMPKTIENVGQSVYRALRKADIVAHEIAATEAGLPPVVPTHQRISSDAQSQELFQVADRNIAEYRQGLEAVMAGVQRSEAQAAVFMTTLDTLRMKMLGHRLVGRSPELPSHEFLAAIAEAKLQLESIDKALDELDLSIYPKTISVVRTGPPPIPVEVEEQQKQHLEGRG